MGAGCTKSQVVCFDNTVDSRLFGECNNKQQVARLKKLVHLQAAIEYNTPDVFERILAKLGPFQEYIDDTRNSLTEQQCKFSYLLLNPLHKACYHHKIDFIQKLLDKGVDPCRLDEKGRSPIEVLLRTWDKQYCIIGDRLRDHNSLSRNELQALFDHEYKAIKENSLECLKLLMTTYDKLALNFGTDLQAPLHISLELNIPEVVEYLLAQGADVELRTKDGNTPIILAAKYFNMWNIQALLDHGADVNAKNNSGLTALHYSCMSINRSKLAIDLLVKYGANVNAQTNTGFTALHYAALSEEYPKVHKLLSYDANPDLQTVNGQNALYFILDSHNGASAGAAIAFNHALCEMKEIQIRDKYDNLPFNSRNNDYIGLAERFDEFTSKPRPLKQLALIHVKRTLGRKRQTPWHLKWISLPNLMKYQILNSEYHRDILFELGIRIETPNIRTYPQVEDTPQIQRRRKHVRYGLWLVQMNLLYKMSPSIT